MDDELKIVVTSILEADEQASAQRIAAQLPRIADLINGKNKIRVQVGLDDSRVNVEAQGYAKQLNQAIKSNRVGVSISLEKNAIDRVKAELKALNVAPDISTEMLRQLDRIGVKIDQISARWIASGDGQNRLLQMIIQGRDQLGKSVRYLQTYDAETQSVNTRMTDITLNLEKQAEIEAKIAAQARADNEARLAYLSRQQTELNKIQSAYTGASSAKPVVDGSHLEALNSQYQKVQDSITALTNASGRLGAEQKIQIEEQIAALKLMAREYQNIEYSATSLRTRTVTDIKAGESASLSKYEEQLRSAGILTDAFSQDIAALRDQLEQAFDRDSLTAYLNSFDALKSRVSAFQEQVRGLNDTYAKLSDIEKQITRTQISMNRLDPVEQSGQYAAQGDELNRLKQIRTELTAQVQPYQEIVRYASQAVEYAQTRETCAARLALAEAEVSDQARRVTAEMSQMPAAVSNVEANLKSLHNPTQALVDRVRQLRELLEAVDNAGSDGEMVRAYQRLEEAISACNDEIREMQKAQRLELVDGRFTEDLRKARAELEAVGRQWSALKRDPGLNATFNQLGSSLNNVQFPDQLRLWRSSLAAFKTEVKAAGKNVQTMGDTIKDNLLKVTQWLSATEIAFTIIRSMKEGIQTVIALDTAMTDLRKTTDATEAQYAQFYRTANETAKALGSTTLEVIQQTAEWSRLGYTMEEAARLAQNSSIFASISEDMDISTATDGLVSIIKAFDIDTQDVLDGVVSKINAVGNAFAVNNGDIVDAMLNSSAAMSAANNTFEETVALATAAIEITRDASSVGNALKTISMRIRGYDEETEEYSGNVAELTGTIADLTKTASSPAGISLFEPGDPETYRSTYDILADIAEIWDELTDKNQAQLLEALFGKHRAQVGAAILSNFDQAKNAIAEMADSAGSAEAEMENITQSLEYKINALGQTWVGVAQNLFRKEEIGGVLDVLNALSDGVDWLTSALGPFGTVAATVFGVTLVKSVRRPKYDGFLAVRTYTPVVTRNEVAA